jgi:cell division inhibitor SepF
MAGLMGKFKTLVGLEEDYYEEEFTEEDIEDSRPPFRSNRFAQQEEYRRPEQDRYYESPRERAPRSMEPSRSQRPIENSQDREKVVAMHERTLRKITEQLHIVVIEPKSFNDCPKLVDSLKSKKPIIINLEKIEREVAKNIFNFLNGATYALGGNVQKIANNIFVFLPANVDVTSNTEQTSTTFGASDGNPWKV